MKSWLPMTSAPSLTVAEVKASRVGKASEASATGICQPGPNLAVVSVCVTA